MPDNGTTWESANVTLLQQKIQQEPQMDMRVQVALMERPLGVGSWQIPLEHSDLAANPLIASQRFADMFDLSPGDGIEAVLSQVVDEDRKMVRTAFKFTANEVTMRLKKGQRVTLLWETEAWDDGSCTQQSLAGIVRLHSTHEVVTGRRDEPESRKQLLELIELLPFTVAIYGRDMLPRFVNSHANLASEMRQISDLQRTKLYKTGTDYLCTIDDLPIGQAFQTGRSGSVCGIEMVNANGRRVPLFIWAKPYSHDANGQVDEVIVLALSDSQQSVVDVSFRHS